MDAALRKFTIAHENDDTVSLLLKGGEYQGIDLKTAVVQIEARRKVKSKIPLFYSCPDIFYPSLISVEQCSSESTAKFKCRFLPDADATLCDLTGGLGVDSFFFSRQTGRVFYCEKNPAICDAVEENFKVLGANNITAFNVDCENLEALSAAMQCAGRHADILFIDPSRRDSNSNRKYALEDCSPNVPSLLGSLFAICPRVLVKASPMLDISFISRLFPSCSNIVALSVDNECKEILMLLENIFSGSPRFRLGSTSISPERQCSRQVFSSCRAAASEFRR